MSLSENIPTYLCKRIDKYVYVDTMDDSGRIALICKHYDSGMCAIPSIKNKRCLAKLAFQREERKKMILLL